MISLVTNQRISNKILAKNPKGRPEDVIADEIERDVTLVHLIATLSKNMDVPTPEAVLSAYKKLEVEGKLDLPANLPAD